MSKSSSMLTGHDTVGQSIPPDTLHAVSVSLPTWRANVGYEEGEKWVVEKMQTGYPRFFIHKAVQRLATAIVAQHGFPDNDLAMLFPTKSCAQRCSAFLHQYNADINPSQIRVLSFVSTDPSGSACVKPRLSCVLFPKAIWPTAKSFWQHTGEGISSRRAEFCQLAFDQKTLVDATSISNSTLPIAKGPKRYQRTSVDNGYSKPIANGHVNGNGHVSKAGANGAGMPDSVQFVEERFGRNLDVAFATQAKLAIRRRIAGGLTSDAELPDSLDASDLSRQRSRDVPAFSVDDVYLYSCGMNAIFHAHLALKTAIREDQSVMYGFPYVDTLKILQKFGTGALFYGHGNADDLDDLQRRLENGERVLCLFCEFPSNPLLRSPDLQRIRALADQYDFAVVVDETIGNFLNIHVLPYADIVVSSLTKIFSGDSNVMGGSMILNPQSRFYRKLKDYLAHTYTDNHFEEDSIFLERNSRDFVSRIQRINHNAELIAEVLLAHPEKIKQVNYPKYSPTRHFYDACRLPEGGYGGLLSATFHSLEDAESFYDALDTAKGPSLGTNFTLSSPFVLLAHYGELHWAAEYGCEVNLVRFSVGLEDPTVLNEVFEKAIEAIPGR